MPRRKRPDEHEHAFHAPIFFGRGSNRLVFRNDQLDRPMPGADPQLLSLLRASLTRVAQTTQLAFKDRLTGEIRAHLAVGDVKFADIAAALKMSQSALLRHLEDENIGFGQARRTGTPRTGPRLSRATPYSGKRDRPAAWLFGNQRLFARVQTLGRRFAQPISQRGADAGAINAPAYL